jgi:hypothetical protein
VQPHYPGMGWGLAQSLSTLVRGVSYYIRVCGTSEVCTRYPRIQVDPEQWGNTYHGISRAAERHLGSPAVVPELALGKRGTARGHRGGRLHRLGTCTKVDRWKTLFDHLDPAYLCIAVCGGIPVDLLNFLGKVYNLCRV